MFNFEQKIRECHDEKRYRPVGVFVLYRQNDPRKFLITQSPKVQNPWSFPQGGIDEGESPEENLRRELREELGVKTNVEFIAQEHYTYPAWNPSVAREVDLFIYRAYNNGPFNPDPTEVEKVQFFKLEEIKKMFESGQKFHPEFVLSWNKGIISRVAID